MYQKPVKQNKKKIRDPMQITDSSKQAMDKIALDVVGLNKT